MRQLPQWACCVIATQCETENINAWPVDTALPHLLPSAPIISGTSAIDLDRPQLPSFLIKQSCLIKAFPTTIYHADVTLNKHGYENDGDLSQLPQEACRRLPSLWLQFPKTPIYCSSTSTLLLFSRRPLHSMSTARAVQGVRMGRKPPPRPERSIIRIPLAPVNFSHPCQQAWAGNLDCGAMVAFNSAASRLAAHRAVHRSSMVRPQKNPTLSAVHGNGVRPSAIKHCSGGAAATGHHPGPLGLGTPPQDHSGEMRADMPASFVGRQASGNSGMNSSLRMGYRDSPQHSYSRERGRD